MASRIPPLLLCTFFTLISGCACEPPPTPPNPDASVAALSCPVSLTYRPQSSANVVTLVGEWDDFDRTAHVMTKDAASGDYTIEAQVPPGTWAYAFTENGAERMDRDASYVRYIDGRPYGALRVADCYAPSVSVEQSTIVNTRGAPGQGAYRAILNVRRGKGSDALVHLEGTLRSVDADGTFSERALTPVELQLSGDGGSFDLALQGLSDGKYRVTVRAIGGDRQGAPLLLPFWIEPEPFSFFDSPMYMAMTDRFRDGDPSNNVVPPANVPHSATFQGGDLQGVEAAIREGYFEKLGIKAIWLTPWQTQPQSAFPSDEGPLVTAYHGYWPVKAREVDPRLGGNAALKSLVAEAHRNGIRIIMDAVLNHVHSEHEYFLDPAKKDWFRTGCLCSQCGWDTAPLTCLFTNYMPDVDWTNNEASEQLIADVLWWMDEFDLDGLRLDAVKHMEESAFTNLTSRVRQRFEQGGTKVFMFGETFSSDYGLIKKYMGPRALDSQLNFPLFMNVAESVFGTDNNGLQWARDATRQSLEQFGDAMMVNFVGNHDVARFMTKADPANRWAQGHKWHDLPSAPSGQEPYDRLHLAMLNVTTIPGVPLIYYGDEYGEFGGSDPDNRHMMNREPNLWDAQRAQLQRMQKLLQARANLRGLRRGPLVDMWCNDEPWGAGKGNLCAYARTDPDPRESAIIVMNLTANTWTDVYVKFPDALKWTGGTVVDALTGNTFDVSNQSVTLDVPARGGVLLHLQ